MEQYINKSAVVAEIERKYETNLIGAHSAFRNGKIEALREVKDFLDTLEVKDPYEQCVQYDSIKTGIQAHAETYSFNIESMLFPQLTKEQQKLWRKEIEQAVISGGEAGVELARDPRYKENLEVKEVDLEKELIEWHKEHFKKDGTFIGMSGFYLTNNSQMDIAKHFFELGLKAQSKDMIEALRTEYEKGRADVIADTISWLDNCWPKYCSNQTIIEGFKEAIKGE